MPLALYLLALAVFAMGTSEFMLAGLVPDIAAGASVSVGTAGLLTSAFAVGMILGAPTMAAFTRRLPMRATLLGCVLIFAACHVVAATAANFSVLFATRVVAAVANAGFLAVALSAATRLVAPSRAGRALAILLSGTTIAMVAGVPAGALLGTALGWRATFWAVALLCAPAAIGILIGIRPLPRDKEGEAGEGPSLPTELAQLRAPRLFIAMLLAALVNGATFAAFTFLAPVVTETAGLGQMWVPVALVLFGIGSFIGVSIAGRLSDQHPRRVLVVTAPLLLFGWALLAVLSVHSVLLLVLVFLLGMLAFAVGSTLIARVLYAASGAPTMGGSYATASLNIGAATGPALGAAGLESWGNIGPIWAATALTALALLVMVPTLRMVAPRARIGATAR